MVLFGDGRKTSTICFFWKKRWLLKLVLRWFWNQESARNRQVDDLQASGSLQRSPSCHLKQGRLQNVLHSGCQGYLRSKKCHQKCLVDVYMIYIDILFGFNTQYSTNHMEKWKLKKRCLACGLGGHGFRLWATLTSTRYPVPFIEAACLSSGGPPWDAEGQSDEEVKHVNNQEQPRSSSLQKSLRAPCFLRLWE